MQDENLKEYVVTLHRYEDLEEFYEDMETPGGNLYIPDRAVGVCCRRSVSRSTHYMLTAEEAETVKNDPRVLSVSPTLEDMGIRAVPLWVESGEWDKSPNAPTSQQRNWGLLRCVEGQTRSNWGSDGTSTINDTVRTTSSGKYVDVVIVDGHLIPDHPEFSVNADGTGGSRVVRYNWFSLNQELGIGNNGTYRYLNHESISEDSHGNHVAGTAAGNSQGWARDSTIYNISPYGDHPDFNQYFIDYVRLWHRKKPIDPVIGKRRPTVVNNSYGFIRTVPISIITSIVFRGTAYAPPYTNQQLVSFGFILSGDGNSVRYRVGEAIYLGEDFKDAVEEGIIMVASSGNENSYISEPSTDPANDYNNYIVFSNQTDYYNRGGIGAITGVISVGGIDRTVVERKGFYSNYGPRVDIYAPGSSILSSDNSIGLGADYRNANYRIGKKSGTSMAAPQVTGVLACIAEQDLDITPASALAYLKEYGSKGQIVDFPESDDYRFTDSENLYLKYYSRRPKEGNLYPIASQGLRPSSGQTWPRTKIYRYGK